MKKIVLLALLVVIALLAVGCVTNTHVVGNGAQGYDVTTRHQWYFLWGMLPIGNGANSNEMAGDATDYTIKTYYGIFDAIVSSITGGLLMTRTVQVIR